MIASFLKEHRKRFEYYDAITGMSKILRRYFVMNSFDGALTTFGLLLGSYVAKVQDPILIIKIGVATAIAIGFSGLTGAVLTETAERKREIHSMEKALHKKLDKTDYKKAYDTASMLAGVVDGLSPLIASLFLLIPFVILDISEAYLVSFVLSLSVFFGLGVYLGRISNENIFITGLKLLGAGIICMIVISFLGMS